MTATAAGAAPAPRHRWRTVTSVALLVLTVFLVPMTVVASWGKVQITDTDRYVATVRPLAEDPDVQQYVAAQIAAALDERIDLEGVFQRVLPADLQPLAPLLQSGVQGFLAAAAKEFTESQAFVELWVAANRFAHRVVEGVLTGRTDVASLKDGQLSVDIGEIVRGFQSYLVGRGFTLAASVDLSNVDSRIVVAEGAQLDRLELARRAVGWLETLVWVLFLATMAAAVGSVMVAADRRRASIRLGVGIALSMLLVAVGLDVARRAFLGAVAASLPRPVASSLFDTVAMSMRAGMRSIFALGVVVVALVAVTRLEGFATRWARPTQVGVAALAVVALIARNAPPASYTVSVLVAAAVAIGLLERERRRRLRSAAAPAPASPA